MLLFLLSCLQEKYDKLVNEHSSLNKKLVELHDDNQRDIETRIQVTTVFNNSELKISVRYYTL